MSKVMKCYYLGTQYPIETVLDDTKRKELLEFKGDVFYFYSEDMDKLNKSLVRFYKRKLKRLVDKRLKHYSQLSKLRYKSFIIEDNIKRWGSCNGKGELTFNFRLMMFPMKAIDYVVVHELCHTKHLNHDRSFWRLVGKYCPDYMDTMKILGAEKTREL